MSTGQASAEEVRKRINRYHPRRYAQAMAFTLLSAARIGEVVGKAKPSEQPAHGPKGTDLSIEEWDGKEVAIFRLYIQKRGAVRYRNVPIPVDPQFEPFGRPIIKAFEAAGPGLVFNYNRNKLRRHAARAFKGLYYDIDSYKLGPKGFEQTVEAHPRKLRLHGLRHVRLQDLINRYRFTPWEASQYTGYSMKSMGLPSALERYAHLEWETYVHKLFKPFKVASNSTSNIGDT